jgi:outer membrane protein
VRRQQELQELDGKLSQQIMEVQQKMSEQLRDTINAFLKEYNKDKKYEIIISNTASDNILYADKAYDITNEVIAGLNKSYKPSAKMAAAAEKK